MKYMKYTAKMGFGWAMISLSPQTYIIFQNCLGHDNNQGGWGELLRTFVSKQIKKLVLGSNDTGYNKIEQIKRLQRALVRRIDIQILPDDDNKLSLDNGGNDYQYNICYRLHRIVPLVSKYFRLTRYTFHSTLIQSSFRAFFSNTIFTCHGSV